MKKIWTLLLIALWMLVLAPVACLSGALTHGCVDHGEDVCGHETDCSDDPCNVFALPLKSRLADESSPTDEAPLLVPSGATDTGLACAPHDFNGRATPDHPGLLVPAAALPLLC